MAAPLIIDAGTVKQLPSSGVPLRLASALSLPSGTAGDVIYYALAGAVYVHNGSTWVAVGGLSGLTEEAALYQTWIAGG